MQQPPASTQEKVEETKNVVAQVASDLSKGVPPSNENLVSIFSDAKQVIQEQAKVQPMPHYQARIVSDVQQVLGDTEKFLQEKNKGEHLQKIIVGLQQATETEQGKVASTLEQGAKGYSYIQGDVLNTADYLRSVALQVVQSPEFRALLLEFIRLIQNSFVVSTKQKNPVTYRLEKDIQTGEHRPLSHTMEETGEDIKKYAKEMAKEIQEGKLPVDKEQQERLEQQWDQLLRKISKNRDFHHAAKGLLAIAEQLESQFDLIQKEMKTTTSDSSLQQVWRESRSLFTEFAGNDVVEEWSNAMYKFVRSITDDPVMRKYVFSLRNYVHDILEKPERLDDSQYRDKARKLLHEGRNLSEKWKKRRNLKNLSRKSDKLITAIRNDPLTRKIGIDTRKLGEHLLLDEQGRPSLAVTQEAIQGLSNILLPVVAQMLKSLPLPTIQGSNETYDWSLDKLVLSSPQALLPEHFVLFFRSKTTMEAPTPTTAPITARLAASNVKSVAEVVFRLQGFEILLNDIHFYFRRKEFPKVEDSGVANVSLTGNTNFLELIWLLDENGLSLLDIRCIFDELNFEFKKTEHSILLPLVTRIFKGTIRRKLETFVEENLGKTVEQLNTQLNQALNKAQHSTATAFSNIVQQQMQKTPLMSTSGSGVASAIEKPSFLNFITMNIHCLLRIK